MEVTNFGKRRDQSSVKFQMSYKAMRCGLATMAYLTSRNCHSPNLSSRSRLEKWLIARRRQRSPRQAVSTPTYWQLLLHHKQRHKKCPPAETITFLCCCNYGVPNTFGLDWSRAININRFGFFFFFIFIFRWQRLHQAAGPRQPVHRGAPGGRSSPAREQWPVGRKCNHADDGRPNVLNAMRKSQLFFWGYLTCQIAFALCCQFSA